MLVVRDILDPSAVINYCFLLPELLFLLSRVFLSHLLLSQLITTDPY